MPKPFDELRERLLHAGVAPRHARRYLAELADHLRDLTAEEEGAGRSRPEAEEAAFLRLGSVDDLATAMTGQRQFQSFSVRAPWAIFGLAPLLALVVAWVVALFILVSGWTMFLPGSKTPFVRVGGFPSYYFGAGRMIYEWAPILIGWSIALIAVRQRSRLAWPALGLVVLEWIAGTAQLHTAPPAAPGALGHVVMNLARAGSIHDFFSVAVRPLILVTVTALPYLIWRLQRAYSRQG